MKTSQSQLWKDESIATAYGTLAVPTPLPSPNLVLHGFLVADKRGRVGDERGRVGNERQTGSK